MKKKRWVPKKGGGYFEIKGRIDSLPLCLRVGFCKREDDTYHSWYTSNCFKTLKQAQRALKAIKKILKEGV